MRIIFSIIVLSLFSWFPQTAQANLRSLLVCESMANLLQSLDNITDEQQPLNKDESILAAGCRYSTLAQYAYHEYPDWWYHVDANNLFFDVNRIKLMVNTHYVEWYTMSLVSRIDEFAERPNFLMRRCQAVPERIGCWTNRGRVFSLDPVWSEPEG